MEIIGAQRDSIFFIYFLVLVSESSRVAIAKHNRRNELCGNQNTSWGLTQHHPIHVDAMPTCLWYFGRGNATDHISSEETRSTQLIADATKTICNVTI